jgi:exosortase
MIQSNSLTLHKPSAIQYILWFFLVGTFILSYFQVWKNLLFAWSNSEEYSHGFFILPIAVYIIWNKRKNLSEIQMSPSLWGLAIVIFSLTLYLASHFADMLTLESFTLILTIFGIILYLLGFGIFKELFFPLFFLLLMIPIPAQIYSASTIPLQLFVSKISVWAASLFGLPIYREGNIIHLPERTLQVVQACSGLRSMISLLTLSLVFGYLTLKSNYLRAALFFVGIPVAIFVNIIRVFIMIIVIYYFDFDLTTGTIHTIYGLSIFLIALLMLYLIRGALSIWEKQTNA